MGDLNQTPPYAGPPVYQAPNPVPPGQSHAQNQLQVLQGQLNHVEAIIRIRTQRFYWIAVLSVVNLLAVMFNGHFEFPVGLGFTQAMGELAQASHGTANLVVIPLNLIVVGIYAALGYFAGKRMQWAYITGFVLYALDTLIFLAVRDWLSIAFHIYILFILSKAWKAYGVANQLEEQIKRLRHSAQTSTVSVYPPQPLH